MKKILLEVKPFQETLHSGMCGPASLKIVLDYYGLKKSEAELAKLMNAKTNSGVNDKAIADAAKSMGLKSKIKNKSNFSDIEKWLRKKVPLIVDWFTRGRSDYSESEVADGHYSVVVGIDKNFIYMQDPEIGGMRKIKKDDFMKVWFDFSGKTIKQSELIIRQTIAVYRSR